MNKYTWCPIHFHSQTDGRGNRFKPDKLCCYGRRQFMEVGNITVSSTSIKLLRKHEHKLLLMVQGGSRLCKKILRV